MHMEIHKSESTSDRGMTVKKVLHNLNNKSGASLAEMLITVLILLMVSSVVAGGVPAAARAYQNAVDAANAYTLLSTTVNALRSELSTAWGIDVDAEGNTVTYFSARTGAKTKLYVENHTIMVQDYLQLDKNDGTALNPTKNKAYSLVTKTGGKDADILCVDYKLATPVTSNPLDYIEFNNLMVYKKEGSEYKPIGSGDNLKLVIRILNPDFSGPEYWVPQSSTGG